MGARYVIFRSDEESRFTCSLLILLLRMTVACEGGLRWLVTDLMRKNGCTLTAGGWNGTELRSSKRSLDWNGCIMG